MANAFRLASCPRSTVRDFVAVAELKLVDAREHDLILSSFAILLGTAGKIEAI